jgi:rubrerythrin
MDFTNPYTGTDRHALKGTSLAQAIRIDMAAELDAINLYTAHMETAEDPVVKAMLHHIIEEEKEHLAEFEQLLYRLDSIQREKIADAQRELEEHGKAA